MRSVLPERRHVNGYTLIEGAIAETHGALLSQLAEALGARISARAEHVLAVRRMCAGATCPTASNERARPKCHAVQSQRFSRNGSRMRQLLTRWVKCRCAGHASCANAAAASRSTWTIGWHPYQRIGSDVDAQIQRWGALSISLRGMQGELAHSYMGVLGQRTLLKRLHRLQNLTPGADERPTPPILQLDAIWFTQLCVTGQWRTDAKGRRRPVKSRRKRCLLIALGVSARQ